MGANSLIQWTDHTFNPWVGCSKVSAACKFCYAETQTNRFRKKEKLWGVGGNRARTTDANWKKPYKWDKAAALGGPDKVFCASLADVFEDFVTPDPNDDSMFIWPLDDWRKDLFKVMEETTNLQWQVLTKRPENVLRMVPKHWLENWPSNVWMGTTVEDQGEYDKRVPDLMELPAPIRFLSMEPLLGLVMIKDKLDWIIVGGESGNGARKMEGEWIGAVMGACMFEKIPLFVKQMGSVVAKECKYKDKKGGDPTEWIGELFQQFDFPIKYQELKPVV